MKTSLEQTGKRDKRIKKRGLTKKKKRGLFRGQAWHFGREQGGWGEQEKGPQRVETGAAGGRGALQ